ncbi:MAG TPA: twin-arginine translocase TatA/TatE family subunit [Methylomirabilota bacterium]|jgi:TatA/E family protein of Tat protein translocase|nr:twin-arginine translocase TatA/TatE family subunit [Methylomirabilota bacterium]
MFDIGLQELVLIFVIALLVFGPKNLPQLGRSLGRAMREFRRASDEFRSTIETNLKINEPDPLPEPAPVTSPPEATPEPAATAAALPESVLNPYDAPPVPVPEGEAYLAQRSAKLFHGRDCSWARRIAEPERVYFKRVAEAREAGFAPCPVCEPWEPAG